MDLPIDTDELTRTLRRYDVAFALVFGSHARGDAREDSDVDLALWGTDGLDVWALRGQLPDSIDLVDLRSAPMLLAGRIALGGVVVLDDDPPTRVRWQAETRKRHLDERWRRENFRRDFVAAHGRR